MSKNHLHHHQHQHQHQHQQEEQQQENGQMNHQIPPHPCPHLADFRSRNGPTPFRVLQKCLRVKPLGRAEIRRDLHEVPYCGSCREAAVPRPRLYACIACAAVFCHSRSDDDSSSSSSSTRFSHAVAHSKSMPPGHEIAVDVDRAELFCCVCHDQIYDRDFDASVVLAQIEASTLGGSIMMRVAPQLQPPEILLRKRRRVDYRPWVPDPKDQMLMMTSSSPLLPKGGDGNENRDGDGDSPSLSSLPWGLRGLNNLGNTCFMNSVLQALLHTPPLRNYFLSDRHNSYSCQQQKTNSTNNNALRNGNSNRNRLCLACDMDSMFSAVFSGDRKPYSPAKFLYSWWQYAANLASYEQQDAHEFFITMLDGIHEKAEKVQGKPQNQGNGDCCIAHRVFSGILRSDVTCTACGFTSTTYDPCVDISLDLEPSQGGSMKMASNKKSQHACNGNTGSTSFSQNCGKATLMGCLDRFTRPERLGSDQKFFCQQCQVRQESLKQMSIRKLPLVSCFHIKRFEHSSTRKMSRKVDRYLHFPFSLDMSPYLSSSILRTRFGNRMFAFDGDEPDISTEFSSEFELFAMVTHTGNLDAGHYVTYLRLNNQWYKCDDAWITQVSENIVRASQGYMLFYVQKLLYYRASEKLVTLS